MRRYDLAISKKATHPYICAGNTALYRCGLTYSGISTIQCWTAYEYLNNMYAWKTQYFYNPYLSETFGEDCVPSPITDKVLEPTPERALLECICFMEYFDEGVVIEALHNYLENMKNDCAKLYSLASKYRVAESSLSYWINEARTDGNISIDGDDLKIINKGDKK